MKGNGASLGQWYSPAEESPEAVNAAPAESSKQSKKASASSWVPAGGEAVNIDTTGSSSGVSIDRGMAWMSQAETKPVSEPVQNAGFAPEPAQGEQMQDVRPSGGKESASNAGNMATVIPLDPNAKAGNYQAAESQATVGFTQNNENTDSQDHNSNTDIISAEEDNQSAHPENVSNTDRESTTGKHIKASMLSRRQVLEKEIAELIISLRKDIEVKQNFTEELNKVNENLAVLLHKEKQKKRLMSMIAIILALLLIISIAFSFTYLFRTKTEILQRDLRIQELEVGATNGIMRNGGNL